MIGSPFPAKVFAFRCLLVSPLLGLLPAGVVHQDTAHGLGGGGEKLRGGTPIRTSAAHQPEVGLVDQRGRLESVGPVLTPHSYRGQPVQLVINRGHQGLPGVGLAGSGGCQDSRDVRDFAHGYSVVGKKIVKPVSRSGRSLRH